MTWGRERERDRRGVRTRLLFDLRGGRKVDGGGCGREP